MKTLSPIGDEPRNYSYVLLHRSKKGKPYEAVAQFPVNGRQCCQATAEEHCEQQMGWPQDFLWHSREYRLVDGEQWRQMQVRLHLKGLRLNEVKL